YNHKTHEELLANYSIPSYNKLLNVPEELIMIMDGTYIYTQKPSDFASQKLLYSAHKHRNLVKEMMVVMPTGYIVNAEGPFGADGHNNDAKILMKMVEKPRPSLLDLYEAGNVAVLDRGFRDVVS